MYLYKFSIQDRQYSILNEDEDKLQELIEKNIKNDEIAIFYGDHKEFMDNFVDVENIELQDKGIYLIWTDKHGYDTYDSARYCAYTEEQAIELSEEKMSSYYKYKNTAELIGIANEDLEIVSSFNAG